MVHWWGRGPQCGPNICLKFRVASKLKIRFRDGITGLRTHLAPPPSPTLPHTQKLFVVFCGWFCVAFFFFFFVVVVVYWPFKGGSSFAIFHGSCIGGFIFSVSFVNVCSSHLPFWCLRTSVLRDYGIFWVSSFISISPYSSRQPTNWIINHWFAGQKTEILFDILVCTHELNVWCTLRCWQPHFNLFWCFFFY